MNIGNLDIEATAQSVTLRMRHVVRGHPGCVLARSEVRHLIDRLEGVLRSPAPAAGDEDLIG